MRHAHAGFLNLRVLHARHVHIFRSDETERMIMMARLANAVLWPGEVLCNLVGVRDEGDSKYLLRMFFNLAIWSKVGAVIAVYWVDWGL